MALLTGALPWRYCTGHGEDGGGGWRLGFETCQSAGSSDCSRHQHGAEHTGCGGSHEPSDGEAPHDDDPCCCDSDLSVTTGTTIEVVSLDAPALCDFQTFLPDIDRVCRSDSAAEAPVERPKDPGASFVVLLC